MKKQRQAFLFYSTWFCDQTTNEEDYPGNNEGKKKAVQIEKGGLGHKDHGTAALEHKIDIQSGPDHGGTDSPEGRSSFPEISP